jgi:hypothetical protein
MHIDFVFLADSATQRPDGRIDAIAIGNFTLTATHFPTECDRFAMIVRAGFEPDETEPGTVRVQVLAPHGTAVAERDVTITPPDPLTRPHPEGRVRTRVVNFFAVSVPEPGTYRVRATVDGIDYMGAHFDAMLASETVHESATAMEPATTRELP